MAKVGQFDTLVFLVMFVILLIGAPLMFMFFHTVTTPVNAALAPLDPAVNTTMTYITNAYDNFWDWVILVLFIALTISLFLSSFMVNFHPIFVVLYIMLMFVMVIMIPMLMVPVDAVNTQFAATIGGHLPYTDFLRTNIIPIVLAIMITSGIITYGKWKLGGPSI
jgi:hypothetical protein